MALTSSPASRPAVTAGRLPSPALVLGRGVLLGASPELQRWLAAWSPPHHPSCAGERCCPRPAMPSPGACRRYSSRRCCVVRCCCTHPLQAGAAGRPSGPSATEARAGRQPLVLCCAGCPAKCRRHRLPKRYGCVISYSRALAAAVPFAHPPTVRHLGPVSLSAGSAPAEGLLSAWAPASVGKGGLGAVGSVTPRERCSSQRSRIALRAVVSQPDGGLGHAGTVRGHP